VGTNAKISLCKKWALAVFMGDKRFLSSDNKNDEFLLFHLCFSSLLID
jgi:hypothetical protein